jgi:hypothetical protein
MKDGDLVRYRCHIGHAYTGDALALAQADDVDRACRAPCVRSKSAFMSSSVSRKARATRAASGSPGNGRRAPGTTSSSRVIRTVLLGERPGSGGRPHHEVVEAEAVLTSQGPASGFQPDERRTAASLSRCRLPLYSAGRERTLRLWAWSLCILYG